MRKTKTCGQKKLLISKPMKILICTKPRFHEGDHGDGTNTWPQEFSE